MNQKQMAEHKRPVVDHGPSCMNAAQWLSVVVSWPDLTKMNMCSKAVDDVLLNEDLEIKDNNVDFKLKVELAWHTKPTNMQPDIHRKKSKHANRNQSEYRILK